MRPSSRDLAQLVSGAAARTAQLRRIGAEVVQLSHRIADLGGRVVIEVRGLLTAVEEPAVEHELRATARAEAERPFATEVVGRRLSLELAAFARSR